MKRARDLLSSSSSEESSPAKAAGRLLKVNKMADEGDMAVEGEVTIKDLFVQLNMMKHNFERDFSGLRSDIEPFRLELQNDLKSLNDGVNKMESSVKNARKEINDVKSNMDSSQQDTENRKATVKSLKAELELQKQRNIKLEQYTHRENIRLLFVEEQPEENTEALFIRILTEMKVYRPSMQFHAVHRQPNGGRRTPGNSDTPRHIIARFVCRKGRFCLESKEAIKKTENYKNAFVVPDLVKELAEEGAKLREAVRCARRVFSLNAAIRNNRFVMLDSGFSYTVKDIPDYIKKELYEGRQSAPQF